ncbi:MAG: tripartite tricarboxylate transporter substrate binding protein [Homoserinimonas sp.]
MKIPSKKGLAIVGAVSVALSMSACAGGTDQPAAEDGAWQPEKNITMIVPFSVGGGSDLFGRAVASGIEEVRPGVNVTVENREGGSGTIGYSYFLEQAGDPHFLIPTETGLISGPARNAELLYDWETFTLLGMLVDDVNWIVANSESGWDSWEEFIEEAKNSSEPITVGLPSADGTEAVPTKDLLGQMGIEVEPVIFDGGGETIPALLSGDIDLMVSNAGEVGGQVDAGQFVPLIGYGDTTIDEGAYEGVPTTGTLDYKVDLDFGQFRGVIAPPEIPDEAKEWYIDALKDWVETDSFKEYVANAGLTVKNRWGQDFQDYVNELAEEFVAVYAD